MYIHTLQYIIGHSKLLHDQVNTKFLNGGNIYDTFTHVVFWKIMVYYIYRAFREGVRGVAGVALATPFFRFCFIKLSKRILKILLNYYY